MKEYYRIMLGKGSVYADECFRNNFIGADFGIRADLGDKLTEDWRAFNREFIPVWLSEHPGKTKVAAGLACGALWTICKGIKKGDVVLSPDGEGSYYVGEVVGDYTYRPGEILPHRRAVSWSTHTLRRSDFSDPLRNSTGAIGTVSNVTKHTGEIEKLISGVAPPAITADGTVEDPVVFALEKHLEDFLVRNWRQTELGRDYDIYEADGEIIGQQYPTDTGPIDILAISKDRKELLVVELKKGRASDCTVGQVQRYMGYVLEELAEEGQTVRGVILALEDDLRIRRALAVAPNIDFYRYQVNFRLFKS